MKIKVKIDKKNILCYLYCMIVLFLPVEIIEKTSFYTVVTPASIWYKYRSFSFSFLLIPLVLYALFKHDKSNAIPFYRVIIAVGIKDIIFCAFGMKNDAVPFDFSLYIILVVSWSITVLVMQERNSKDRVLGETFLDWYFLLAFLSMLLRLFLHMTTDGRYGAIGLSVGGTGFFAAIYIIYCLYVHQYTRITPLVLTIAFLTLVLSGQRTNLLLCIMFCIPFIIRNIILKNSDGGKQRKILFLWGLLFCGIILICVLLMLDEFGIQIYGMEFISRTFEAISKLANRNLGSDTSVEGRFLSIKAGKSILRDNVLGITNVFYDLQYRMNQLNYPTYPHSGVLDCMLLWSTPVAFFCEIWLIHLLIKLAKKKKGMFWVILYIQLLMIIWGSPFLDYPMLFIILLMMSMGKIALVGEADNNQAESVDHESKVLNLR